MSEHKTTGPTNLICRFYYERFKFNILGVKVVVRIRPWINQEAEKDRRCVLVDKSDGEACIAMEAPIDPATKKPTGYYINSSYSIINSFVKAHVFVNFAEHEWKYACWNPSGPASIFKFDACYDETTTQATIFEHEVKPALTHLFMGHNVTLFAFGQCSTYFQLFHLQAGMTGTGKTHTMQGSTSDPGETYIQGCNKINE